MKIEIDLTKLADPGGPKLGRVAATALLSALPADEAELAIVTWRAGVDAASDPVEPNRRTPRNVQGNPITDLEFSVRTSTCLAKLGVITIQDLVEKTEHELLGAQSFGRKSLNEVKEVLDNIDLRLSPARPAPVLNIAESLANVSDVGTTPTATHDDDPDNIPFEVEAAAPTAEPVKTAPPVEQPGNGAIPTAPLDDAGLRQWIREHISHHVTAIDITKTMAVHGGPRLDDMTSEQRSDAATALHEMASQ